MIFFVQTAGIENNFSLTVGGELDLSLLIGNQFGASSGK